MLCLILLVVVFEAFVERIKSFFAEKLDVGTTTLQRYENDERSPDFEFINKLQQLTGYSFDYLISGKEPDLPIEENLLLSKFREATSDVKIKFLCFY